MGFNVLGFVKCLNGKTQPIVKYSGTSRIQQAVETFKAAEQSPTILCSVTSRIRNQSGQTIAANMKEDVWGTTFSDMIRKFYR